MYEELASQILETLLHNTKFEDFWLDLEEEEQENFLGDMQEGIAEFVDTKDEKYYSN